MAGIDFGAFMNTFVGLQQRQAEETRQERDDAFEIEAQKLKLAWAQEEGQRQERYMQLQEAEGARQAEEFPLEQQRRELENQTILQSKAFAAHQNRFALADAMAAAEGRARSLEAQGFPDAAQEYRNAIQDAKATPVPQGTGEGQAGGVAPGGDTSSIPGGGEKPGSAPSAGGKATEQGDKKATTGAIGGMAAPAGVPAGAPTQPSQYQGRGEDFYRQVQEGKSGESFQGSDGQTYLRVDSPEQVEAVTKFWKDNFNMTPPAIPISKKEMEIERGAFAAQSRTQRMNEIAGQQQEDLINTIDTQNQLNQILTQAKSTARVVADAQGVRVENFNIDNLPRERSGMQALAAQGKLNRQTVEAYNRAFQESFQKRLAEPNPATGRRLIDSVAPVSPGEFRVKLDADPKEQVTLQNAMAMSKAIQDQGVPPALTLRPSSPKELVQDFENGLPQGSQQREQSDYERTVRGSLGFQATEKPIDPSVVGEVESRLVKLTAAMSRSMYDIPPGPGRDQALAEAKNQLSGMLRNYYIGQPSQAGEKLSAFAPGPQGATLSTGRGGLGRLRDRYQQLLKIMTPKGQPKPGTPAGKPVGESGGGPISSNPAFDAVARAGILLSMGAQENVAAANKAWGSVTQKDTSKASNAVTDVKREFQSMTDKEKTTAQSTWKAKRGTWKKWGVKDSTLKEMNLAVGLDKNDGLN